MLKKLAVFFSFALLLSACSQKEAENHPTTPLSITTVNGDIRFNVEVAQTPDELQKGLMYRTEMPLTNGMIFSIYPVRPVAMWMKNTQLSLDMIFVAPDATISMIKEHTTPLSEDKIISRDPVRAVIEVPAGNVMRYNIKVGDKVQHAILNNMTSLSDEPEPMNTNGPVIPKGPNAVGGDGPVIPKGPNAIGGDGPVIPKGPNAIGGDGPVIPKGPNAIGGDGPVIPKGPNAIGGDGPVIPKGPNAVGGDGSVIPKGPNAQSNGPVVPKGPNAQGNGQVIPKGPNAPVPMPMPIPASNAE